jgi:tRNA modification GTPase
LEGLPKDIQPDITVWNKIDIGKPPMDGISISARTGEGIPTLLSTISELCAKRLESKSNNAPLTRARHRTHLEDALGALERSVKVPDRELFGEDLRLALRSLGRITGRVDIEDILDVVFREFCIGK